MYGKLMVKFVNIFVVIIFTFSSLIFAGTIVNGRFVQINHDSTQYTVKFQLNTNSNADTIGCSTIIFDFDTTALAYPSSPTNNTDYSFLNFDGSKYNSTITRPLPDQIWINIESISSDNGTTVAQSPAWTDVVELTFKILDKNKTSKLTWQTTDNNWAIYDADNSTVWNVGTWLGDSSSLKMGVTKTENISNNLPKDFRLFQNYPNPFNPSTTVKYAVPYASRVNITVYDITGRVVKTLVNEDKPAGTYSVQFNAENLASGMYLYRIACGNFTQVKKMVLLK